MSRAPVWDFMPRWLQMLHTARQDAGNFTYQEIAKRAALNKETVGKVFNNEIKRPRLSTLAKVFAVLDVDEEKAREIRIALYAPDLEQQSVAQKFEPLEFRTDAQILAAAINNLADAVRGLSLLDRRQER